MDIDLAGTEGPALPGTGDVTARYPDSTGLCDDLAVRFGVAPAGVIVTAGADEALERAFRAFVGPGDDVILTAPTFDMLPRYARMQGAHVVSVPWLDTFPADAIIEAITPRTTLVAVVTPNNPTGLVAPADALRAIHDAAPGAALLADLAYVEYADVDPTTELLTLPRAVVVRTMSKAWGLAGARVGFALGEPRVIEWLRRAGNPYPVAAPSIELARSALATKAASVQAAAARCRDGRVTLERTLNDLTLRPTASQANFACARPDDARWMWDALAGCGVATRLIGDAGELVRITAPPDAAASVAVERALRTIYQPEALILDMDGVIADVSQSYRSAIVATAAQFGVRVAAADVAAVKRAGHANDDWQVTLTLVRAGNRDASYAEVRDAFEQLYQGSSAEPGLRMRESLIGSAATLRRLAKRYPIGIATGRPRADAEHFLGRFGLDDVFAACVTRDDGAIKPDPFAPLEAMRRLGATRGWMVGDTPDDVRAARSARLLPIGVIAPGDDREAMGGALLAAGAARVLTSLTELETLLP